MDSARDQVKEYYESGTYAGEVNQIIDETTQKLSGKKLSENSAVIFDVDDTVLSSYEYTRLLGFGFNYSTWIQWMHDEKLTAIPQVKKIYDWLIEKDISVIFLTGRRAGECNATYNNLIKEGYTKFDTLICRPDRSFDAPASDYKSAERKALTDSGYDIIACFGDQWSDLAGDYTGIKVKLPNYLYQID
ncbi:HAD family acid phosphatase [Bacteroidota bacterium]